MRKLAAIVLLAAAIGILWYGLTRPRKKNDIVNVHCSPELTTIVSKVGAQFESELGTKIEITETLLPTNDLSFGPRATVESSAKKEIIPITKVFSIGVLANCQQPAVALQFARYLAAPEKGGVIISQLGFKPNPGDAWAEKPDLILYSGGVNRPAVESLLTEFSEREGVDVTTVFNGCGILCASMKTMSNPDNPGFPDAYFACDLCFVPPVAEHFDEVILLTETDIGIAIPKDNPHKIKTLTDLAKPGLKVGLCNQEQSTLGYMTQGILRSSGLKKSINKNVVVGVPTADFLITQLRSEALDAAIVYRVNAELQKEEIEFIKIKHEGARAVQPFSVRSDSRKRQLANRLQDHFLAHPEAFEETGFIWRGGEAPIKSSEIEVPAWLRGN